MEIAEPMRISPGSIEAWRKFYNSPPKLKKRNFLEFCQHVVNRQNNKEITIQQASFEIAEAMFDKEINETPELFCIIDMAGELELPPRFVSGNHRKKWAELKRDIEKLLDKY